MVAKFANVVGKVGLRCARALALGFVGRQADARRDWDVGNGRTKTRMDGFLALQTLNGSGRLDDVWSVCHVERLIFAVVERSLREGEGGSKTCMRRGREGNTRIEG